MDKKKVLIVSRSFDPDNSPRGFRTTELAKEFARQGHDVTVITPRKGLQHDAFEKEHRLSIKDMGSLSWSVPEIKGTGIQRLVRRAIVRFAGLWFEYPNVELLKLVRYCLKKESGYDLLISIAVPYPVHWGVASARKPHHPIAKCWIADCGDPYMGAENDSFKRPFYFSLVEKWFSRKADFITVPTQGSIAGYYPEFQSKLKVIPQGFRFEDVKTFSGAKTVTKPTFGYAGNFIPNKRDPAEFLNYLISLEDDYLFYVYTGRKDLVLPYAARSKGRIIVQDPIPRLEVLYELSKLDFVVNFENTGNRQTPSKLIDYAILDKPVLPIVTGALNEERIGKFLKGNYEERYLISNPDQYRIENICQSFINLANQKIASYVQ